MLEYTKDQLDHLICTHEKRLAELKVARRSLRTPKAPSPSASHWKGYTEIFHESLVPDSEKFSEIVLIDGIGVHACRLTDSGFDSDLYLVQDSRVPTLKEDQFPLLVGVGTISYDYDGDEPQVVIRDFLQLTNT